MSDNQICVASMSQVGYIRKQPGKYIYAATKCYQNNTIQDFGLLGSTSCH